MRLDKLLNYSPAINRLEISSRGKVSLKNKEPSRIAKLFPFIRKDPSKKAEFTYQVMRDAVSKVKQANEPGAAERSKHANPKIDRASEKLFKEINENWKNLSPQQKEQLLNLPQNFASFTLTNKAIYESSLLDSLQSSGKSLGADLHRTIANGSIEFILPDKTVSWDVAVPGYDAMRAQEFAETFSESCGFTEKEAESFSNMFANWREGTDYNASLKQFEFNNKGQLLMNSISQRFAQKGGELLRKIFPNEKLPNLVKGTHDEITFDFSNPPNSVVTHKLKLNFPDNPKIVYEVRFRMTYNDKTGSWEQFNTQIKATSDPNARHRSDTPGSPLNVPTGEVPPKQIKALQARINRLGFGTPKN